MLLGMLHDVLYHFVITLFSILQGYEVWQAHGAWVSSHKPDFGPGILERFKMASRITADDFKAADAKRQLIKQHMEQLLGSDGLLALPSAPGPAVELNTPADKLDSWRKSLLSLTCIAGLAGLPQVRLLRCFCSTRCYLCVLSAVLGKIA